MKSKNFFQLVLIMAAMVLIFSACSSSKSNETVSSQPKDSESGKASVAPTISKAEKYEVTSFQGVWAKIPDPDSPGIQAINEKFNINFKPQIIPMDAAPQKIAVLMASGGMTDVIGLPSVDSNFVKWAKQGAFLPLNEYFDKYRSLNLIPESIRSAVTVDGKIYAIPQYFTTKYRNSPIIRQDWLDKLNLKMPTSYKELLQVSIAFTTGDPDGNGKNDTFGFVMSSGIDNEMSFGAYWDSGTWYNKDSQGQFIPGVIAESGKERIQFLQDAYKAGAVPKDWPVMTYKDARNIFFGGKAGIYYDSTPGNTGLFKTLIAADPKAVVMPLPPFKAPDGSVGIQGLSGWYQMHALNGKLKDKPEKVDRILSMIDYFSTFIEKKDNNPDNPDFDWKNGGVGKGYTYTNGVVDLPVDADKYRPISYFATTEWAPNEEALHVEANLTQPMQKKYAEVAVKMWGQPSFTYIDPINSIYSDLYNTKFWDLQAKMVDEQTKMILGEANIADWDKMVQDFLKNGGSDIIHEVNQKFTDAGLKGHWE
jgi:putative aldouronate transport system substrate-binding protein